MVGLVYNYSKAVLFRKVAYQMPLLVQDGCPGNFFGNDNIDGLMDALVWPEGDHVFQHPHVFINGFILHLVGIFLFEFRFEIHKLVGLSGGIDV